MSSNSDSESVTKANDKTAPINSSDSLTDEIEDQVDDNLEVFKS